MARHTPFATQWRAYLELARPANVATALADVLAGFGIAGLARPIALPPLLAASAALYAGGVILNDVFDRHLDARERPERPIPSGRVSVAMAAGLGAGLLCLGVLASAMAGRTSVTMAAILAGAIVLYDGWGKRRPVIGPLNMGLCRALNLLLGMSAVPAALGAHWHLGWLPLAYIAAVTAVSRGEVLGGARLPTTLGWVVVCGVLLALTVLSVQAEASAGAALAFTGLLAWRVLPPFWRARRDRSPASIRQAVMRGVLSLVLLDAVLAAAYAGMIYSLVLLGTAVVAGRLARAFAVT
jgi:4-hydroxybenzoate polyprenyltransferase